MTLAAASPDALANVALASLAVIGLRLLPQAFGRTRTPIPSFPGWLLKRMGEIVVTVGLLRMAAAVGPQGPVAGDQGAIEVAICAAFGAFLYGVGHVVTIAAMRGQTANRITPPRPPPRAEATMTLAQPSRTTKSRSTGVMAE